MTSNNPTHGYDIDCGDVPPIAPSSDRFYNANQNTTISSSDEREPIFRSNEHSLPTLEQVRTEAANVLARQQYSSDRFNRDNDNISYHDDDEYNYSYKDTSARRLRGNNSNTSGSTARRRFKLLVLAFTCIVAAVIICSIVYFSSASNSIKGLLQPNKDQSANTGSDVDTESGTNPASDSNSNSNSNLYTDGDNNDNDTDVDDIRLAIHNLLSVKISYLDDLELEGTPQYYAVQWLVQTVGSTNDIPTPDASYEESYTFIQRYIVAVLFYSLDGPNWFNQCNFLSKSDNVCDWNTSTNRNDTTTHVDDYIFGIQCKTSENAAPDEITHIILRTFHFFFFFSFFLVELFSYVRMPKIVRISLVSLFTFCIRFMKQQQIIH
jgi:hypothetical protein